MDFFLYDRFPRMRTEIIIASTNAEAKAPAIRRALGSVLGLPSPGGDPEAQVAQRPDGTPAPAALVAVLNNFIQGLIVVSVMADHVEPYRVHGLQFRIGG